MFRASLCSSSGEQTIQKKTACGECLQHEKEREVWCSSFPCFRHSPHAVFCIVCSPDDEHNDARDMLS